METKLTEILEDSLLIEAEDFSPFPKGALDCQNDDDEMLVSPKRESRHSAIPQP